MEELEEIPLYPYIKSEKRGLDSMRLNVIDVRTGELLAWMDEGKGPRSRQGSMAKKFKSEHVENLNDHVLKVESEESSPFDPTSVFISCLDVRTTKEEIFSHFIPLGEIVRVTKLKDRKSGNYNGSAYVQFRYPQSAEDALFLHGSCVSGTDAVFPADRTHSMKFVSLNAIFLSFPIGCQFQFQILADRWLDSSMLHSCSTSCT